MVGGQPVEEKKERNKWSPVEDRVLISAWLNTSKDPIVGNEQKGGSFWKRITSYYNASEKVSGLPHRDESKCKQRWQRINDHVCKFVGCLEAANNQKGSGQKKNDIMKLGNQIFLNDQDQKFTLEHAWRELRHDQKWQQAPNTKCSLGPKRRKVSEVSQQASSAHPEHHVEEVSTERPTGVKAAKRALKQTASVSEEGKSVSELGNIFDLKQKDFTSKDKHMKHRILDNLLAKTEPLSEKEIILKDKLIDDMINQL